jgi:hypothetical protein
MTTNGNPSSESDSHEISRLVSFASTEGVGDIYAGKRRWPRYSTGMQFEVAFDTSNPSDVFPVTMHNVSDTGLAFWSKTEVEPGADVYLREFTNDEDPTWVGAQVTHCTPGIRGYLIGAKFHNPLEPGDAGHQEEELVAVGQAAENSDNPRQPSPQRRRLFKWLGLGRRTGD